MLFKLHLYFFLLGGGAQLLPALFSFIPLYFLCFGLTHGKFCQLQPLEIPQENTLLCALENDGNLHHFIPSPKHAAKRQEKSSPFQSPLRTPEEESEGNSLALQKVEVVPILLIASFSQQNLGPGE